MNKQLIVEALQTARKYLWNGVGDRKTFPARADGTGTVSQTEYICHALDDVWTRDATTAQARTAVEEIQVEIINRLSARDRFGNMLEQTFEGWLQDQPGVRNMTRARVQAHRLAWINKLIEEFSA